jgi:hypothetical protein
LPLSFRMMGGRTTTIGGAVAVGGAAKPIQPNELNGKMGKPRGTR